MYKANGGNALKLTLFGLELSTSFELQYQFAKGLTAMTH